MVVIIGGIKRIAVVAERLVPGMIVLYMGAGFYVILSNIVHIPAILMIVLQSALTSEAVVGGFLGHTVKEAIRFGVARGTLSNESGIGSCSIPAAAAKGNESAAQGMVVMMGTFIDTIIVCSMTTFVILNSNLHPSTTGLTSTELTKSAFAVGLGHELGGWIVSLSSLLFGYTTLIGWSYYGEQGAKYLWGVKSTLPAMQGWWLIINQLVQVANQTGQMVAQLSGDLHPHQPKYSSGCPSEWIHHISP